ncbi:hypothetical protein GCM10011358_08610 [Sinisalibacter lacisalsi]|uniref:Uncharacterized protein n=1 Tax=Sinisalibacter lacisalsi TaxID=1526570 RepID=A0ABQ1QID8_9RHOB|nr:hypothetical protein GCM10011358_08610 [Sinisalibacter lacisalsi]
MRGVDEYVRMCGEGRRKGCEGERQRGDQSVRHGKTKPVPADQGKGLAVALGGEAPDRRLCPALSATPRHMVGAGRVCYDPVA